jgi:hypothetical protein
MDEKPNSTKIKHDKDYSIVMYACNTDTRLLQRSLEAVKRLDTRGLLTELILVDHNSTTPLSTLGFVQAHAGQDQSFVVLRFTGPAVKYACTAALEAAQGRFTVFIDAGSEPAPGYLQELKKLHERFPQVGIWGAGNVSVEFIDGIDGKIEAYARTAFQERHTSELDFYIEKEWEASCPSGAGLCAYTFLLKEYDHKVHQGTFTQPTLKHRRTGGAEDAQIVMLCVQMGYPAGVSPTLQLNRLVPRSQANRKYLQQLAWGTSLEHETCMLEVFPERRPLLLRRLMPEKRFARLALRRIVKATWHRDPMKKFELIRFLSNNAGIYAALSRPLPPTVARIIRFMTFG